MAIIHAVRSDNANFDARYSWSGKTPGTYAGATASRVVYTADASAIGGNIFDMDRGTSSVKMLYWNAHAIPTTARAVSVLARIKFGSASITNMNVFERCSGNSLIHSCLLNFGVFQTAWAVEAQKEDANECITNFKFGNATTGTAAWTDLVFTWTGTNTASGASFFVDGALISSMTPGASLPAPFDWKKGNTLTLGSGNYSSSVRFKVNELVVWDEVINVNAIPLDDGTTASLTGATRTAFVTVASFDGLSYTDPGVANVSAGLTYIQAGTNLTGSYVPTNVTVSSGSGGGQPDLGGWHGL